MRATSRISSSVEVEYSPLRNGSLASTSSARSRVVGTPSIVVSRSARSARAIAAGRSESHTTSFATASRSTAGSTRRSRGTCRRARPGPAAPGSARSGPGDGRKSNSGSSAFSRISIACPRRGARPVTRERLAGGDPQLLAHDVDSRAELGDRMLDLQARVQLDEVEAPVGAEQELERAGVAIADGAAGALGRRLHRLARLRRQRRRRRLLDQLLVAPLDRALALAEREHVAEVVAEHLDLDVAGRDERLLDVERRVAEGRLRLGRGRARTRPRARRAPGRGASPCRRRRRSP